MKCEVTPLLDFPQTRKPGLESKDDPYVELGQGREESEFWRDGATKAFHSIGDPEGT